MNNESEPQPVDLGDFRNQPTLKVGQPDGDAAVPPVLPDDPRLRDFHRPAFSSELGTQWGTPTSESRIIGDYELLEKIGSGGMGVVYKARQISLNRLVAFKTIAGRKLTDHKSVVRFDREAKVVATLDHPGIVPVFDIGEDSGRLYFSMEYIEGQSLAAKLQRGVLPPRLAAEIVANVAEAVHHAHQQGILHRDIKPSNILLDKAGKPRIIDFGLALRLSDGSCLTTTNAVVGTPNYMAPERATADLENVGIASDIYSLGAILYECLVGKPPFVAATAARTMELLVNAELVEPRRLNPLIPEQLNKICVRCLAKNPAERFPTAEMLANDLRNWLAKESSHSEMERPEELAPRSRLKISVLNVASLIAVAVLSFLLLRTSMQLNELKQQLKQLTPADAQILDKGPR